MAALTSTGVNAVETWKEGGTSSRKFLTKKVVLTLVAQGGATNNIPAALFGMKAIWYVRGGTKADNTQQVFLPSYDMLTLNAITGGSPADVSGTFSVIVAGKD